MCIICNAGRSDAAVLDAMRFLEAWSRSGEAMHAAADALLRVSRSMPEGGDRKRYNRLHKRMVRAIRDWNRLEQMREAGHDAVVQ